MIEYMCDICKSKKVKEQTRSVVIHPRDRKIWSTFPVKNPNRKKFGTRLVCLDCLKEIFKYVEENKTDI